jgi:predicted HTH domain antitoxin
VKQVGQNPIGGQFEGGWICRHSTAILPRLKMTTLLATISRLASSASTLSCDPPAAPSPLSMFPMPWYFRKAAIGPLIGNRTWGGLVGIYDYPQQDRLTLAQASSLAETRQLAFQALLAERQIPIHYGVEEFREDLRTLRRTEHL